MNIIKSLNYKFAHHHLHTEYSPQDAPVPLKKMVDYSKSLGYKTVTVTDHGVVSSWVKLAQTCKENGIRPIFGLEAYFVNDRKDKTGRRNNYHLILIAKNNEGIKSIYRMSEIAWKEGYHYDPRIDWEVLEQHSEGVICSTACIGGIVPDTILNDQPDLAKSYAERLKKIFKDDFYMELQYHDIEGEEKAYSGVAKIASEIGVKVLGTNDVHYLLKEDAFVQEVLVALKTGRCVRDPNRMRHTTNHLYLKSPEEMIDVFGGPNTQAIQSALEIADKCNAEIKFGKVQLPGIDIPKEFSSDLEYLIHLSKEGLKRIGKDKNPEYLARFEEEIGVVRNIREKGFLFDRYFLIVADYVKFAKDHDIMVGVGRGSGAGSLLLYCLGITGIDPIKYDLLFERFLTPDRNEMPDIDIDFCAERGDEVIKYVVEKYGADRCARIGTVSTFHVAGAIKAAFRAFDPENTFEEKQKQKEIEVQNRKSASYQMGRKSVGAKFLVDMSAIKANEITKKLPKGPNESPSDKCTLLKSKYLEKPEEYTYVYSDPEFKALKEQYKNEFMFAEKIEGMISSRSIHAAGILITENPLVDVCPQQYAGKSKELATVYDMGDVEKLGLIKFDFLRTKVLSILNRTLKLIKNRYNITIDINNIPDDDPKVLALFARADTSAIFQFESRGMRGLLSDLKADCFGDLIAANALFRPGPMEYIPTYVKRKHGQEKVTYPVELLEGILKPTFGIMVYQEQVMKITRVLAGFDASTADKVRKAMGKKKRDLLDQMKEKFAKGVEEKKTASAEIASKIWKDMEAFGEYAFNKSHSAGYAFTAYQSAFLKTYYPAEFMASQLTVEGSFGDYETTDVYEKDLKKMKIELLPIKVNESKADYRVVDAGVDKKAIRKGYKGVSGLGGQTYVDIEAGQPYKSLIDFCQRAGNGNKKNVIEILLTEGAFDGFLDASSKRLGRRATRKDLEIELEDASKVARKLKNLKGEEKEVREIKSVFDDEEEEDFVLKP